MFVATSSGGATNSLTDLQTGNSIGDTLNGQTIIQAQFNSVDGAKIISAGGSQILDSAGRLVGTVPSSAVQNVQMEMSDVRIPISLNYAAQWVTSS